jgi:hypothetical protein
MKISGRISIARSMASFPLFASATTSRSGCVCKKDLVGKKRKRKAGGGRKGALANIEQKLLFGLVYQKSYPVQSIMGELFGMGQTQANEWIHSLLPILKQALDDLGYEPERDPKKFKESEQDRKDAATSIIDGTERRRQRPKDAEKQALHYSGRKKIHSDKNLIVATAKKKTSFFSEPNLSRQNAR